MHFLIYIYLLLLVLPHFIYLPLIFKKLNIPAYQGYIPFYNWWICLRKMDRPWYWFLILLSPGLNIFMLMTIQHDLARHFGFHSLKAISQAIFFPFFIFKDIANSPKQWVEKTDWTDTIFEFDLPTHLADYQKEEFVKFLEANRERFATTMFDLGTCNVKKFDIITSSEKPIYQHPYRKSEKEKQSIRLEVEKMLQAKIIEP